MSGHSKWSTIKHKKAKEDAKRGSAFTKLIKEITVCVKTHGSGNPEDNPRLRTLLDKARDVNMPNENVTRAIKKGTGELEGVNYEEFMYEGYGPHGSAIVLQTLSDNKNRTVADLRHIFSRAGGNLAENGSVSWMFEKKEVIKASGSSLSEDDLLEKLLDYDISDLSKHEGTFFITCEPRAAEEVKKAVQAAGLKIDSSDIEWVAKNPITLDKTAEEKVYEFLEELGEHDDVQNVYANLA